jgi:flagellar basal body-associated protein FliL
METTLFILIIVLSVAVLILLGIMIAVFIAANKLMKTIQRIAEIAQDGTKTAADIVHEVKEKIINPMTMSAIFAQIMRATSGNKRRRR